MSTTVGGAPPARHQVQADPSHVLERLSQIDLIHALPPEEVQAVVPYVEIVDVPMGRRVFAQGDVGDGLYFIEKGIARLVSDGVDLGTKGPGDAFGEMALLTGEPRSATVVADTDLRLFRIPRDRFDEVVRGSARLEQALRDLADTHRTGLELARATPAQRRRWRGAALRAMVARRGGIDPWQVVMAMGLLIWAALFVNEAAGLVHLETYSNWIAIAQLVAGLTILQGSCEAFILAVERLGARQHWDGFISGTIGSLVATLPEFVVIAFLVSVEPLAAFITAAVTIFNNAVAFSIYSFFLPKDQKGQFVMPASLAKAGGEVLVAGSGIAMIVGALMLAMRAETPKTALAGADLLVLASVLILIYGYYTYVLLRYYSEGDEGDHPSHPPDPHAVGHPTGWRGIVSMLLLGVIGAYTGGESIGGFADTALNRMGLPIIPTAAGLAFFAGISEYIIVWKAHRRGELGIALSSAFGGMTQVMFLLLPFSMIAIAVFGLVTGSPIYRIPINTETTLLMLLLFPLFYVLLLYLREDHTLNNLDAAAMTGIYALLLYFLFTAKTP